MSLGLNLRLTGRGAGGGDGIPAVITIVSVSAQESDGDVPVSYTIDKNDPSVECVVFAAAEANPTAADFNGGGAPTYVDQGTVSLTTTGSPINLDITGTFNGSVKLAFLPRFGGDSDVVVSSAFTLDTTAPTISTLSPADNATDVAITADLVMTFSEAMKTQGTVDLRNVGGALIESFDLSTDGVWSSGDTVWTGNPASDFTNDASLCVRWSGLEDTKGNALADNTGDTTWDFTVASGAFDPASLFASSEVGGWWDPSDLSTMWKDTAGTDPVTTSGDLVARIDDKSGNGRHLIQSTESKRPTYTTAGGLHWLDFDGTSDALVSNGTFIPGVGAVQAFSGAMFDAVAGGTFPVICEYTTNSGSTNGSFAIYYDETNGPAASSRGGTAPGKVATWSTSPPGAAAACVLGALANTATPRVAILGNGTERAANTTTQGSLDYSTQSLYVGARNQTSLYLNGRIYGLLVRFGSDLSSGQIDDVEQFMATKAGVTL